MIVTANKKGIDANGVFSSKEMGIEIHPFGEGLKIYNCRGEIAWGIVKGVNGEKPKSQQEAKRMIINAMFGRSWI